MELQRDNPRITKPRLRPRLLAASCLIASAAHAADGDVSAYQSIVGRYRAGDFVEAARQIASWHGRRLLETTARLRDQSEQGPSAQDATAIAARCLLHLEVLRASGNGSAEDGVHLRIVFDQLHRLRAIYPAAATTADVHLALALHLQGQLRLEDLRLYFDDVGDSFASDSPFLLAKATLYETLASRRLEAARKAALVPSARDSLERAERILRGALEVEPKGDEARLRLAHVLALQAKPDEARRLLEAILQGPAEPSTRYLAQLFLGQVEVTAGHLTEAKTSFAAGRAECACGQAASVALAHLTFGEGRRDAAREILGSLEPPPVCVDPWSVYDFGQIATLDGLILRLREAVRQQ